MKCTPSPFFQVIHLLLIQLPNQILINQLLVTQVLIQSLNLLLITYSITDYQCGYQLINSFTYSVMKLNINMYQIPINGLHEFLSHEGFKNIS